jgi:chromosome segregation ATPase
MRGHVGKLVGIGVVALVVGAVCGAGLGRADAGSAQRYADAAQDARARELEAKLADMTKERDRLRADNEAMQGQLRASAPAVDLGGVVSQAQAELQAAKDAAQAALARSEKELAEAKASLANAQQSAERESARWRQQAQEAQAQVEPLRREVADLRQQIVTLNETIKTMKMFGGR